jgi:hypothetical protein
MRNESPQQAARNHELAVLGRTLRGPEKLRSAHLLVKVSEHFRALGMTLGSAPGALWSTRGAPQIRWIKTSRSLKSECSGALCSFSGPRRAAVKHVVIYLPPLRLTVFGILGKDHPMRLVAADSKYLLIHVCSHLQLLNKMGWVPLLLGYPVLWYHSSLGFWLQIPPISLPRSKDVSSENQRDTSELVAGVHRNINFSASTVTHLLSRPLPLPNSTRTSTSLSFSPIIRISVRVV